MGTIVERKNKSGGKYRAQVIKKDKGKIVLSKSATFARRSTAAAWIKRIEREFKAGTFINNQSHTSVGELIDRVVKLNRKDMGKTKCQVLDTIKRFDVANYDVTSLRTADLVEFATEVAEGKHGSAARSPATTANYLSHLSGCLKLAKPAFDIRFNKQILEEARETTTALGITGKSKKRTRRPSMVELDAIMGAFADREAHDSRAIPMSKIVPFAIFSARRQAEITRILWDDYSREHATVLVRDMKDPGEKEGNDVVCELPPQAVEIIESMPRVSDRIFPFHKDVIGRQFTGTCKFLEIRNLRFHDLRHEAASWLIESGRTLAQAMSVTGHKSWSSLQRYSHMKTIGNKYDDWRWLSEVLD
ncbi:tyrosine-type recombinase/integrase [Ruegeria arenilitoris]|uniref:tyrosine-type recombinase/integrase n=1 Tax=Ruegeria arenilitoris TaxID=1173585 RepID=UPI0014816D4A|nr:tyrosine-type recombinase/integrase [Ruegeria arenilitoris]